MKSNMEKQNDALFMLHYYNNTHTPCMIDHYDDNILLLGVQHSGKTTLFRSLHHAAFTRGPRAAAFTGNTGARGTSASAHLTRGTTCGALPFTQDPIQYAKIIQIAVIAILRKLTCNCHGEAPMSPQSPTMLNAKLALEQSLGPCPCSDIFKFEFEVADDDDESVNGEILFCARRLAKALECGETFYTRNFIRSISCDERKLDDLIPLELIPAAQYYLGRAEAILQADYVPSNEDLIYISEPTCGIQQYQMTISGFPFNLIDVGGSKSERRRWIHCFESVACVFFCVDLCSWNCMEDSLSIFGDLCNSIWVKNAKLIVLFNKKDLFKKQFCLPEFKAFYPQFEGETYAEAIKFLAKRFQARNRVRKPGAIGYTALSAFDYQEVHDLTKRLCELAPRLFDAA
jgi:GTPase SAR1 family protein